MRAFPLRRRAVLALGGYAALGVGCRRARSWPPEPVPVVLGEDTCAACRMIISDARFGAQLVAPTGRAEHFDDLGCLLQRHRGGSLDLEASFVRAFSTGTWIRGDNAWVLSASDVPSPMGYGLAGFADEPSARAEALTHPASSVLPLAQAVRGPALVSKGAH